MFADLGAAFDLIWKLLLVLGLAVIATRGLRWLSAPQTGPNSPVRMIARLPVGPQQTVVLVAVGSRRLLIGQSPQQLTVLADLAGEDLDAALSAATESAASDPGRQVASLLTAAIRSDLVVSWQRRLREHLLSSRRTPSPPDAVVQ